MKAALLLLVAAGLSAQVDLPAPRARFRVGLAELVIGALPSEHRFIGATLPRLLYEALRDIDSRVLTQRELETYAAGRLESARLAAERRLSTEIAARNRAYLDPGATAAARAQADTRVERQRSELRAIGATRVQDMLGPAERPLEFWSDHEAGRLIAPPGFDPTGLEPPERSLGRIAEAHDLDLLLWGTVESVEGYLAVDLFAFHRFLGTNTFAGGTVALPEEVGLDAGPVAAEVAAVLLGRPFATLVVEASPVSAAILVDGELAGYGAVTVRHLPAGPVSLVVRSGGYAEYRSEVVLWPGATERLIVDLRTRPARGVRIESSPSGADVYVNSVWRGRTPHTHVLDAATALVRLRLDGYLESRFVVDHDSPSIVARALLPGDLDWSVELRTRRDVFYRSIGWFALSVPATVLLRGGFQSVLGGYPPPELSVLEPEEQARLARLGNIYYWSSVGALLVNAGLFANAVIALLDYVAAGLGSHNQ